MDGYTLSISRCSGGDGVEESFKAKIKRREAALDAFAVAEAYCKESWMVSRCEREGFDGFIIDLCSDAEDEAIRLVRLVPDSEDGIILSIGAEEYLSRINIKVYEGDENGNLVFEGGAAECLAWADGYCGDC